MAAATNAQVIVVNGDLASLSVRRATHALTTHPEGAEAARRQATFVEHVRGFRVMATDAPPRQGAAWTERLRSATAASGAQLLRTPRRPAQLPKKH
jgi:hypothetical protein